MGRFVWVGQDLNGDAKVYTTDDNGASWIERTHPANTNGDYVANIAQAGAVILISGSFQGGARAVAESTDDAETFSADTSPLDSVAAGGGITYSPTDLAALVGGFDPVQIIRGTGGPPYTWVEPTFALDIAANRGAHSASLGRTVVGGADNLGDCAAYTDDGGATWASAGNPLVSANVQVMDVARSEELGLFVAVGIDFTDTNLIATSPDGANGNWTPRGNAGFLAGTSLFSVEWNAEAGIFIAGGNQGEVATSPDGINWTIISTPLESTTGLAYGDGGWMATGLNSSTGKTAATAPADGSAWTALTIPADGIADYVAQGYDVLFLESESPTPGDPLKIRDLIQPARIIITDIESRTLALLDQRATDGQFLFELNGPATHTAQVSTDDVEINRPFPDSDSPASLTNNRRLCFAFYRDFNEYPPWVPFFGGIVMQAEDQGADASTCRYTAADPWQYMMSRPIRDSYTGDLPGPNGLTFPAGSYASLIALELLETTQIVEGETHIDFSDLGLVEFTDPLPDAITFAAGLSVGEAWQQLCDTGYVDIVLRPIYDPLVRPTKVVEFIAVPQYGSVKFDAVMAWDMPTHSLAAASRLVDGTRLLNRALYYAGDATQPVPLQSDAASIAAYGEYWSQQFFPDRTNIDIVAALALAQVQIRKNGARTISFDATPEFAPMPFRDYGLGDYLPVWASRNFREPLAVDYDAYLSDPDHPGAAGYQRVYAIPVELDNSGVLRVRGIVTSTDVPGAGVV